MFAESGAFIFGRRTYEIANGWGGRHPVNGVPTFVLTHRPPADYPRGPSNLTFVTDGIESAIRQARAVGERQGCQAGRRVAREAGAGGRLCATRSSSTSRPTWSAAACGCSTRCPDGIRLEKLSVSDGPFATHLRYRVLRA